MFHSIEGGVTGGLVWGQCGKTHIRKLQTLQNRGARIVAGKRFEETDHALLLKKLQWLNVEKLIDNDNAILVKMELLQITVMGLIALRNLHTHMTQGLFTQKSKLSLVLKWFCLSLPNLGWVTFDCVVQGIFGKPKRY